MSFAMLGCMKWLGWLDAITNAFCIPYIFPLIISTDKANVLDLGIFPVILLLRSQQSMYFKE